jgi:hypothetical protein
MTETRTERGSCKFEIQELESGHRAIVVELFHDSIGPLKHAVIGFSLLSGIQPEQAKKIAENS